MEPQRAQGGDKPDHPRREGADAPDSDRKANARRAQPHAAARH